MTRGLELESVGVSVRQRILLEDLSLQVQPGDCLAVVGPNGAGKTTLFRTALGLLPPSSGTVRWDGQDMARLPGRKRAQAMAWLPQQASIREAVPVLDFVKAARFRFDESHAAARQATSEALEAVGGGDLAGQAITTLSGGELQRVLMATLVAQDAQTFLLDEPANHLDPARQLDFYRLISEQWRNGRSVVCVTHDINLLSHLAPLERAREVGVLGLKTGRVSFRMSLDDPALSGALEELFELRFDVVDVEGRPFFLPRESVPS